jgi:hypothetical protein
MIIMADVHKSILVNYVSIVSISMTYIPTENVINVNNYVSELDLNMY